MMNVKRLRKHHGEMWFIRLTCWKKYDACPALCQTGTEQGEQTERNIRFIDKASKYRIKGLAFVYGYLSKLSDSLKEQSNEIFDLQFLSILWTTLVIALSIWKNRMNSTFSSKSTEAKQLARQGIEYILAPKQTRRPLPLLLSPSFFYAQGSIQANILVQLRVQYRTEFLVKSGFNSTYDSVTLARRSTPGYYKVAVQINLRRKVDSS